MATIPNIHYVKIDQQSMELLWDRKVHTLCSVTFDGDKLVIKENSLDAADPVVERNRRFDVAGEYKRLHDSSVLPKEQRIANVLIERANALRGVGRPDKVPGLLKELWHAAHTPASELVDFARMERAFFAIEYQPPEDD